MKNKITIFILLGILLSTDIYASSNNKLALQIARSKNLTNVIKRVNTINEFINLYVLQEGKIPNNISTLVSKYQGINIESFKRGDTFSFTINNNIVKFTNIIPTNTSTLIEQIYRNSPILNANAIVVISDNSMNISLNAKSIQFLSNVDNVKTADTFVQLNSPVCNGSSNGKLWYKPDSIGGFDISYCDVILGANWENISNKLNIVILKDSSSALDVIKPNDGTIGYVKDSATTAKKYIYSKSTNDWLEINN